jgi:hypothetical protein
MLPHLTSRPDFCRTTPLRGVVVRQLQRLTLPHVASPECGRCGPNRAVHHGESKNGSKP